MKLVLMADGSRSLDRTGSSGVEFQLSKQTDRCVRKWYDKELQAIHMKKSTFCNP